MNIFQVWLTIHWVCFSHGVKVVEFFMEFSVAIFSLFCFSYILCKFLLFLFSFVLVFSEGFFDFCWKLSLHETSQEFHIILQPTKCTKMSRMQIMQECRVMTRPINTWRLAQSLETYDLELMGDCDCTPVGQLWSLITNWTSRNLEPTKQYPWSCSALYSICSCREKTLV